MPLIARDRSIIPACDVPFEVFERLVKETASLDGIGGYKVGAALALSAGLPKVVQTIRDHTDKPIIYDHQKAGSDIPETAKFFMDVLADARVDSVILFPHAGPATQRAWVSAATAAKMHVIVGGMMTHPKYLASDGGYIRDDAPIAIYEETSAGGVTDFVVPGNQPDVIRTVRAVVEKNTRHPVFYAPGFISQGGDISDAARAAGSHWHAIVGRAIFEAADMRSAAEALCTSL